MTQVTEVQEPTAFVRFARKTTPAQYQTEEASVSLPVPIPEGGISSQEFLGAVNTALQDAKVEVWTALGIEFEVVEGELIEKPSATVATPAAPQTAASASNVVKAAFGGGGGGGGGGGSQPDQACGVCGGATFNNTAPNAKKNPRGPDFKCRDRDNCGAAMWTSGRSAGEWKF